MTDINSKIVNTRRRGVVRCGLSSTRAPTLGELARQFGLHDDPTYYREIDITSAREPFALMGQLMYGAGLRRFLLTLTERTAIGSAGSRSARGPDSPGRGLIRQNPSQRSLTQRTTILSVEG